MAGAPPLSMICRRYRQAFGATLDPNFQSWLHPEGGSAALGYARAGDGPLFLERYLDQPIEQHAARLLGREVRRDSIIEIGNFAAENAMAMIQLWANAANDLGSRNEIAAATLTLPLRRMFGRLGIPVIEVAAACPKRLGSAMKDWGAYYTHDPRVCIGVIADGQRAIADFFSRRRAAA